eukprot:20300-Heterococcus_DN1.PRE.2
MMCTRHFHYTNTLYTQAGSTATTALILGGRIYVANVGDSRTIVTRSGKLLLASEDHKPQREDEEERIRNAGGFIVHKLPDDYDNSFMLAYC